MRAALWLAGLFAVAAALAIFAGSNPGTVTLYWAPYRIDLSLNLVLLGLLLAFVLLHLALRAVSIMFSIPAQARRWRLLQKERAIHTALLESLSHLFAGRFIRARKSAERVIALETSVLASAQPLEYAERLRALAHLLAAESAHALQDRALRDVHFRLALEHAVAREAQDMREGVQLRAARWAFDDRDAQATLDWLNQLPQGAARRTLALRLRFKAVRLAGQPLKALELARLLTKHRAFSGMAGRSIARGLAMEHLRAAHDPQQLVRAWDALEPTERLMPDVAMQAAEHLLQLGGETALARQWLLPVWDSMARQPESLTLAQRVRLARVLEASFGDAAQAPDAEWLRRIESLQMAHPGDAVLQYLAAVVCLRLGLWGKAQQLLRQSLSPAQDPALRRDAWRAMALLAEQRQDSNAAIEAYRQALRDGPRR